jgi:hypothetical protein
MGAQNSTSNQPKQATEDALNNSGCEDPSEKPDFPSDYVEVNTVFDKAKAFIKDACVELNLKGKLEWERFRSFDKRSNSILTKLAELQIKSVLKPGPEDEEVHAKIKHRLYVMSLNIRYFNNQLLKKV